MPHKGLHERPSGVFMNERNVEIYHLYTDKGMTGAAIGRKFGIKSARVLNIVEKMTHILADLERLRNPTTPWEYVEALFYPDTRIINALKNEGIQNIKELRELINKIDNSRYGVPNLGERSLRVIREILSGVEQ